MSFFRRAKLTAEIFLFTAGFFFFIKMFWFSIVNIQSYNKEILPKTMKTAKILQPTKNYKIDKIIHVL